MPPEPVGGPCSHRPELIGIAGNPGSPIHRLDPRAKLLAFLAITVVAVSTPFDLWPVYVACALVLSATAALAAVPPRVVWQRARIILPLVLLVAVFLPFVRKGGPDWSLGPVSVSEEGLQMFVSVAAKATIGTASAILLGATTTYPDVLRGLELLRVPRLFVLIAGFMYRYLFVIVDEVQRMRAALASRGYAPRHALRAAAIGRVVSALFLRSYARGERVYLAMLSRGYDGVVRELRPLRFGRADGLFLGAVAAAVLAARVTFELSA